MENITKSPDFQVRQVRSKPQQQEDEDPKPSWSYRIIVWLLKLCVLIALIFAALFYTNRFFDKYDMQIPVKLQPLFIEQKQPEPKTIEIIKEVKAAEIEQPKVVEEKPKIDSTEQIVYGIFGNESTWGKADGCTRKGLFNGYGYRQNAREFVCYKTRDEVKNHVIKWVEDKKAKGFTVSQLLCYYNTGYKTNDCKYYQDYLKIKDKYGDSI